MNKLFDKPEFYDPRELFGYESCEGFGTAPKYNGTGTVKALENYEKFNSYYLQADGANEKDYKDYIAKLEKSGYKLYFDNSANDCLFATYFDGYNIVNVSYVTYISPGNEKETIKYVNIAIESVDSSALPLLVDNSEKITDAQFTMINSQNIYLVRLEDGRFIFIDGGVDAAFGRVNADLIYEQLVAQNVREGKPVVAAWIVTHAHADHLAGFMRTMQKYGDNFDVESLICNFIGEKTNSTELYSDRGLLIWADRLYNEIICRFPDMKVITAHMGQKFVFSGLTIDILFTPENLHRDFHYENESSVVYRLNMPHGKVLITGDQQREACKIIKSIYGDLIKVDLLQYAHHCHGGGDRGLYAATNAKYGLWANAYEVIVNLQKYARPDYNGVDHHAKAVSLAMSEKDPIMVLKHNMTKKDLAPFIRWTYNDSDFYDPCKLLGHEDCKGYGAAPKYEGSGEVRVFENNESFKSYYLQVDRATKNDYENYVKKLEYLNFLHYFSSESQDGLFSTYFDGYNIINISYINSSAQGEPVEYINIAVDCAENVELPPIVSVGNKVADLQISQINGQNAFLVRLEDGRFVFIDGGDDGKVNEDIIYDQLVSQNVLDGKPIVAAWLVTRPNNGYMTAFMRAIKKYGDKLIVEKLVCNAPGEKVFNNCSDAAGSDVYRLGGSLYNDAVCNFPKTKIITTSVGRELAWGWYDPKFVIAHKGQRFVFPGLNIDVLWTFENLHRNMHTANEATVVYHLDISGEEKTILPQKTFS